MRCKFREQDVSTAIQCQTSSLSYTLTQFRQWVAGKTWIATTVVLLGLGEGFWVTTEVMAQSARFSSTTNPSTSDLPLPEVLVPIEGVSAAQRLPSPLSQIKRDAAGIAQDHTKRVDLSLERQPNETYETLLLRAEAAAREAAQTSFDQDIGVTDVSVIIVAQNQGAIAPVLSLEVNRAQWLSRPDVQRWITYFVSARALLQFEDVASTTPDQPETANPLTKPRQLRNGTTNRSEPANSYTTPGQPTNGTAGQTGTANSSPTPGQPTNGTAGQTGTAEPIPTPSQQTPPPGSGLSPQPPASAPVAPVSNPLTPTVPNVSPGSPSTSNPTSGAQNPSLAPSTSGTTNNNPFAAPTTPSSTTSPGI